MNRVWDYIGFAVWFAGLGYIVLWLVGSPDHLMLPPALHVARRGLGDARSRALAAARRRPAARSAAACAVPARKPAAVLRPPRRKPAHPLRPVKPRSHFGLRGMPR